MKNTILTFALLLGIGLNVNAQNGTERQKPDAKTMTEKMKSRLELTDQQYKAVYTANEEMIKKMEEAGGREADRTEANAIKKEHLLKLNEVLTPEQMEKVKSRQEKRAVQRKKSSVKQTDQ